LKERRQSCNCSSAVWICVLADDFHAVDDVVEGRSGSNFVFNVPFAFSDIDGHGVAVEVNAFTMIGAGEDLYFTGFNLGFQIFQSRNDFFRNEFRKIRQLGAVAAPVIEIIGSSCAFSRVDHDVLEDRSKIPGVGYKDGFEALRNLQKISGVPAPERLAALETLEDRFTEVIAAGDMKEAVLAFARR